MNDPCKICDRLFPAALLFQDDTATAVRISELRINADGFIKVSQRLRVLLLRIVGKPAVVIGLLFAGIQRKGFIKIEEGQIILTLGIIDKAAIA